MRITIGLFLIIVCFMGTVLFRRYDGTIIPYPILWYLSFIVLGLFGVWLISSSLRQSKRKIEQVVNTEIETFRANSERIKLDFEKCEFKSGSFYHQADDPNMSTVHLFAPGSLASIDTKVTETVVQSYLTYEETFNGETYKYISQSFPFDQTTLKFYVLNHNIVLNVDRFDRKKYLFDLKR